MKAAPLAAGGLGRWSLVHWPWLLVAVAWATSLAAAATGWNSLLNHHELIEHSRLPWGLTLLVFLLAWQLMTAAMMLPSTIPLLRYFRRANSANQGGPRATLMFLAGYAAVWTAFAAAAFTGDTLIHHLVDEWGWLAERTWLIAGSTLVVAGGFQFTSLKERCLAQCRSPFSFFVRHYRRGVRGAWSLGVSHGKFCLGCCWALMLLMFGLGVGHLVWMTGLAGIMLLERTALRGRKVVPAVGVLFLVWGVVVLWHPIWLPEILSGTLE